jgi:hypothetical protein
MRGTGWGKYKVRGTDAVAVPATSVIPISVAASDSVHVEVLSGVGGLGGWACRGDLLSDVLGSNSGLGSWVWPGVPGTSSSSDPGTK